MISRNELKIGFAALIGAYWKMKLKAVFQVDYLQFHFS